MTMVNKNTIELGPIETQIISRLSYEKTTVITKAQLDKLFRKIGLTKQLIYRLRKKGILKPIIKGIYYYSPIESGPSGARINEFLVPSVLFPKGNYYVGYSPMYNYYGFTDQVFQTFYVLNTALQRERIIDKTTFKLLKVSPDRMYGIDKVRIKDSDVFVSDRERTLVDLAYFPEPVGGLEQAFNIICKQIDDKKLNIKKFLGYVVRFPSISTRKRIGFALENCGISDRMLAPILKSIKNSSLITLYGSKSRKGKINNKWKVIVDAPQQ